MVDVLAAVLSGGLATHEIPRDPLRETGLSQVFIAFDVESEMRGVVERIIDDLHASAPRGSVTYPGERTLATRRRSLEEGVSVDPEIWRIVSELS
jgi:3-dehydro-L-gulonate 2-dehydrogenase